MPETVTVAELMTLLGKYDPETKVLVPGYENGWDYLGDLELVGVKPNKHTEWWDGDMTQYSKEIGEVHLALHRRPKER